MIRLREAAADDPNFDIPIDRRPMAPTIQSAGEHALIERLRRRAGAPPPWVTLGIGDDAAVIQPARGAFDVVTADSLVEGVHFRREWTTAGAIGHKALAVNLSDLAAMGATPRAALPLEFRVTLSAPAWVVLPYRFDPGWALRVNDRVQPVRWASGLAATSLEAGTSRIQLEYHTVGLEAGRALSRVALLLWLGMAAAAGFAAVRSRPLT